MAKKRGGGLFVPVIKGSVTIGALNAHTLIGNPLADTVVDRYWAMSADIAWGLENFSSAEGPLIIGLAHSDYEDAEIEEFIELAGTWDEGNLISREVAKRKIRIVGVLGDGEERLNAGKMLRTVLKFMLTEGDTLKLWVYNDSATQLTSGGVLNAVGKAYMKRR